MNARLAPSVAALGLLLTLSLFLAGVALAEDDCRRLEAEHKLQEAVWCLRRAGATKAANQLRQQLAAILATGKVARTQPFAGGGTTTSELIKVTLAEGISGMFKPAGRTRVGLADQAPDKEIAASRLDEVLELDVVPLTIARTVAGRTGSLQYFVEGVKTAGSRGDAVKLSPSIKLLDALLANFDRHAGNYLIDARGRQIAIDHNLTFDEYRYKRPADLRELIPTRRVYGNLKRVPDARIRAALKGLVDLYQIDRLLHRKRNLLQILDRLTERGARTELFERD